VSRVALGLLALLALIWGVNWPIMKVAVHGVEPWTFRAYCALFGGLGLLAIARAGGHSVMMSRQQFRRAAAVAPFSLGGWIMFSAIGVALMGSGRAAIIAYTMPLWAILAARWLLSEPLTRRRITALVAGLCAMVILLSRDFSQIEDAPLGAVFMLCAAVTWGTGTVLFKRIAWQGPVTVIVGWQLLFIFPPIALVAALTEDLFPPADLWAWLGVLYNIGPGTAGGFYLWNRIVLMLPAGVAAIGSLAVPVIGVLSGALILDETIGWREATALALVVGAIMTVMRERTPPQSRESAP